MITALCLFLPTTIAQSLFLYLIPAFFKIEKMKYSDLRNPVFKIIILIVVLSLLNFIFCLLFDNINVANSGSILTIFPYSLFMIPAYLIAINMNRSILIYLLYMICFEIFIGVLEYAVGAVSFFGVSDTDFGSAGESLLYNKRVCGLSLNSSTLALKCLLGLIVIYLVDIKRKYIYIFILLIGFFITFNRTYIISSIPLIMYFYWSFVKQYKYKYLIILLGVICMLSVIYANLNVIIEQFLRGTTAVTLDVVSSGRDIVYSEFWSFFMRNIFTGNGSVKLWLELMPFKIYHAHNSFLMTLASNGIIITLLYFCLTFIFIRRKNLLPMICLIIASLAQYTIFWGISLADIIFIVLLLTGVKLKSFSINNLVLNRL